MSPVEVVLLLIAATAIGMGAYTLLIGGDRRQRRIDSDRTHALEHVTAPGATDLDPTHLSSDRSRRG